MPGPIAGAPETARFFTFACRYRPGKLPDPELYPLQSVFSLTNAKVRTS
jgi:hypothetical protein